MACGKCGHGKGTFMEPEEHSWALRAFSWPAESTQTYFATQAMEKEMATHSRILAWRIPWMEEPGRLQSMGSQRLGHDGVPNDNSSPRGDTFWLQGKVLVWVRFVCVSGE